MPAPRGKRKAGEPELMGASEVAAELGARQTNIRQVVGLPEAYDVIAATTLWRAEEIREFAAARRQRRGLD